MVRRKQRCKLSSTVEYVGESLCRCRCCRQPKTSASTYNKIILYVLEYIMLTCDLSSHSNTYNKCYTIMERQTCLIVHCLRVQYVHPLTLQMNQKRCHVCVRTVTAYLTHCCCYWFGCSSYSNWGGCSFNGSSSARVGRGSGCGVTNHHRAMVRARDGS